MRSMSYIFYSVGILGVCLQGAILLRALYLRTLRTFPYFYTYIAAGLIQTVLDYAVFRIDPSSYARVYWASQLLTLLIGCGLLLELFGHVLSSYPGAARLAKAVCIVTFGFIFLFVLSSSHLSLLNGGGSQIELERDVRTAQIFLFTAVIAVALYYRISLTRNMRGMMCGYGVYLGGSLVTLALRSYLGHGFDVEWALIQPLAFDLSLAIWLISLWWYERDPFDDEGPGPGRDYQMIVSMTQNGIRELRSHLGRSTRG